MDSLVDMDILNLGSHQDINAVSSLIADSTVVNHETEADLESYRVEMQELQDEVDALKTHKKKIESDIDMCGHFVERATLYTVAIGPIDSTPKTGGSKWGVLKSSVLAKPEDAFSVLPPNTVHLPVQPEFAKFFYLTTKLEMARRTSKFLGIRAKGPRAEYIEKCAEMRSVIVDAATQKVDQLSEDIAIVQKVHADAMRTTLSILEPPPVDRPFSSYLEVPTHRHRENHSISPPPPPPSSSAAPVRHTSVSFAPPPPLSTATAAPEPPVPHALEQEYKSSATPRRRSILHDFRSRSYAATMIRTENIFADPAVADFNSQVNALVESLPTAQHIHACLTSSSTPSFGIESEDVSMYRIALQAHCAETLDSFHAEMERKMKDCVELCSEALARRSGPLSSMKSDPVFSVHIAEVLGRVDELKEQLQSYARHQQNIRENTQGEHAEMVQQASVTVVQQRLAFLTRIKEKLSSLHVRNQQQAKESRKLALIGNAARYQLEAANNLY